MKTSRHFISRTRYVSALGEIVAVVGDGVGVGVGVGARAGAGAWTGDGDGIEPKATPEAMKSERLPYLQQTSYICTSTLQKSLEMRLSIRIEEEGEWDSARSFSRVESYDSFRDSDFDS
jgi:hypothetical protein